MILDILPLAGGTARLVRVYGGEPCVKLPGAVPAPEGEGQWPITELGDYCFSEKPRGLPGPEKICRYERAEDGKLCLTRAFGRDVSGKERYSFDFDAPAAQMEAVYSTEGGAEQTFFLTVGAQSLDGSGRYIRLGGDPTIYEATADSLTHLLAIAAGGLEG